MRVQARAGRLPLPPGFIDEPLLPEPVRFRAGAALARVRIEATFARRGRRRLAPPALVLRDPLGLAERVVTGAGPRRDARAARACCPVRAAAGGGEDTRAHARAVLIAAAETEIDGLRAAPPGLARLAHPLAGLARGDGMMERKMIAEADSRPLVVLDPRAPRRPRSSTPPCAPRGRSPCTSPSGAAARCCSRATGARVIEADLLAWPAAHVRLALLERDGGPALAAAQNRRGLILLRLRPAARPPAARPRPDARRLPARRPGRAANRRAVLEVAGCHGYLGARAPAAPRAMEAVAG